MLGLKFMAAGFLILTAVSGIAGLSDDTQLHFSLCFIVSVAGLCVASEIRKAR